MKIRTILLVEDTRQDELLILRSLKKINLANEVDVVRDGQQALDYLFREGEFAGRGRADLPAAVLLDLSLPRVSGLEVLERLRADPRTRLLPIVVLTSSDEERDRLRSYESGANSFVRKPLDFQRTLGLLQARHPDLPLILVSGSVGEEKAAEAIIITDAAGAILYVNPAFEKVTGYTRHEVAGQNPRILKSGKHDAEFYRRMWATLTAGAVWSSHLINKRKNGTFYEEDASISSVLDATGKVVNYVAVKRDVTEQKKLEAQFLRAQRLEGIGALASGIAHDLNNILAPMLMIAPLLRDTVPDDDSRMMLTTIESCAQRGADVIKQLLLFARGTPGARGPAAARPRRADPRGG